jgi:SSS family transporter
MSCPDYYVADSNVTTGFYPGCARQASFFGGKAVLPEAAGYGIVIGFGVFFSIATAIIMGLDKRYGGTNVSSEYFNTAGRNVKTGLTASVIVSQWTWAATLLQSSNVAYQYGVSGPFWYASGATIQVLLFGMLAIQVKRYAPNAHTICEIIDARWGANVQKVFIFFCFMTNVIVSSMLVLGGAATVNALTGMNTTVAGFLIPLGVIAYTMSGGLKATFLASYIHTAIIFAILITFIYIVYAGDTTHGLGSPGAVYDKLVAVASRSTATCSDLHALGQNCGYVAKNQGGSYLTMLSEGGVIFGIINIVGNFGTVFVDQSYWQSAIAAKPSSSTKGYLLGGLVWFTIPFALATAMGLATVALDLPVTSSEAGSGLVPPAVASHLLGKGGAAAITIMLFMAIVSTGSAEQIAVSSMFSYDVYRKYIKPNATGEDILRVSRYGVVAFGVFMGLLSLILDELALSLGFVYLMMGIFIGSAVMPISFVLTWDKANGTGAVAGAVTGLVLGLITWVVTAAGLYDGTVTIDTLGQNYPMLAGNVVAICSSGIVHAAMSYMNPQNFDFSTLNDRIQLIDDKLPEFETDEDSNPKQLEEALAWIKKWGLSFTFVMIILWPVFSLPAGCGTSAGCGVFNEGYFSLWVGIALAWGTVATAVIIILPVYESWDSISVVLKGMFSNDDVHLRMDLLSKEIAALKGEKVDETKLSTTPGYRAKLLVGGL